MQRNVIIWVIVILAVLGLLIWGFSSMGGDDADDEDGGLDQGADDGATGEEDGSGEAGDLVDDNLVSEEDDVDLGDLI